MTDRLELYLRSRILDYLQEKGITTTDVAIDIDRGWSFIDEDYFTGETYTQYVPDQIVISLPKGKCIPDELTAWGNKLWPETKDDPELSDPCGYQIDWIEN